LGPTTGNSSLGQIFEKWSVVAALAVLPAVVLQTLGESFVIWGEALSVAIWVFFLVEVTVMLRLAPDNPVWARSHALELSVVVLSCPALLLLADEGSAFAFAPLLVLGRLMRLVKFVKFVKVAKILKTFRIVDKDDGIPGLVIAGVTVVSVVLVAGILGMVAHHDAHNFLDGLSFWVEGIRDSSGTNIFILAVSGVGLAAVSVLAVSGRRRDGDHGDHQD
jgi:hypothetical protein